MGGFQGRTNKLVDSCYSFWQGGAVAVVQAMQEDVPLVGLSSDDVRATSDDGVFEWASSCGSAAVGSSYKQDSSGGGNDIDGEFEDVEDDDVDDNDSMLGPRIEQPSSVSGDLTFDQ